MLFGLVLKRNLKFDLIRVIFTKGDTKTILWSYITFGDWFAILILICLNTNNLATRNRRKKKYMYTWIIISRSTQHFNKPKVHLEVGIRGEIVRRDC
jgi:hypothetical protein